jgi:hypothetical protein
MHDRRRNLGPSGSPRPAPMQGAARRTCDPMIRPLPSTGRAPGCPARCAVLIRPRCRYMRPADRGHYCRWRPSSVSGPIPPSMRLSDQPLTRSGRTAEGPHGMPPRSARGSQQGRGRVRCIGVPCDGHLKRRLAMPDACVTTLAPPRIRRRDGPPTPNSRPRPMHIPLNRTGRLPTN